MSIGRGYRDWQREVNYDGPLFEYLSAQAIGVELDLGSFDVSRYAYLAGRVQCLGGDVAMTVAWYADDPPTKPVGVRIIPLTVNVANYQQFRLLNLGPFCVVALTPIDGAGNAVNLSLFPSNRVHPLEFIPENPVAVDQQNAAIAASATNTHYPGDYYAGPVDIYARVAPATLELSLQALTLAGTWDIAWQAAPTPANADVQYRVVTPPGAWRIQVINNAGAPASYYLNARPSMTGST